MIMEHVLEDKELGRLLVRVNVRARRLTFRTREDAIHVTVPPGTTIGEVKNAVEQLRPRLRAAREKQSRPLIDLDYRIDTEFFKLSLVGGERDRFLSRSDLGDSAVDMGIRVWVKTEDYWPVRWRLLEQMKNALDENGISIPFPQMDVSIRKE